MPDDDYICEEILTEHAEDAWHFVTLDSQIFEDYLIYEKDFSIAEYVKNIRWIEFLQYMKDT